MNNLCSVATIICVAAIVGSIITILLPKGSTKKTVTMVLGVFLICCMILPVKSLFNSANNDNIIKFESSEISATDDETFNQRVMSETEKSLESALQSLLESEQILVSKIKISLKEENQSVKICKVCIYIKKKDNVSINQIKKITEENLKITPDIILES